MEQVFVDLSVVTTQSAVELPVGERPRIDKSHCMRSHVVQGKELEELVHGGEGVGVQRGLGALLLEGLVEVLDYLVLRIGGGQAPEVDQEAVPGLLLLISVLESLEGQERHAPCESINKILITVENVECGANVLSSDELLEDLGDAVVGGLASEDGAGGLEEVSGDLLGKHVVVALPCDGGQTFSGCGGCKGLKRAGDGVQIGKMVTAGVELLRARLALRLGAITGLSHALLVGIVEVNHSTTGEMQGVRSSEQRKETVLHHGVVEDLVLASLSGVSIAVLELSSHGTVAVDTREAVQHVDVGDLDVVEKKETVVHGVVTELGTNVTNVDIGEGLMGLHVADGDDEGVRTVGFAVDDQLGDDDSVVSSLAQRSNPPLGRSEMRRVHSEGLILRVPRSRCLKTADIRTVAQLSLCVTSDDLIVARALKEKLMLRRRALLLKRLQKHSRVQTVGSRLADELIGCMEVVIVPLVPVAQTLQGLSSGEGCFESVCAAAEVVLRLVEDGVCLEDLEDLAIPGEDLLCEEEAGQLIHVNV
ncbi:hypothetical protein HG530_013163 [Fusarium avenaceum]|nr:hypothetical protein HG530_013163 [Fusarium avenaceum]